jgi:hypothetical protein
MNNDYFGLKVELNLFLNGSEQSDCFRISPECILDNLDNDNIEKNIISYLNQWKKDIKRKLGNANAPIS